MSTSIEVANCLQMAGWLAGLAELAGLAGWAGLVAVIFIFIKDLSFSVKIHSHVAPVRLLLTRSLGI